MIGVLGCCWLAAVLLPFAVIGETWGSVWFDLNRPLSLLVEAQVGIGAASALTVAAIGVGVGIGIGVDCRWEAGSSALQLPAHVLSDTDSDTDPDPETRGAPDDWWLFRVLPGSRGVLLLTIAHGLALKGA